MTAGELMLRRGVVCTAALIYWGGVWLQARRVRRQIGRSPNLRPRGLKEVLLWLGWFVVIAVWAGQPLVDPQDAPAWLCGFLPVLVRPAGLVAGSVLVAAGYAGTLWCYAAMGGTWRIGVAAGERTELVSRGPYQVVRHPIYLFQIVILAGSALLLPTPASLAILAVHFACVLVKAADEERHLTTVHGGAYRAYLARTGGLLPRFGRR